MTVNRVDGLTLAEGIALTVILDERPPAHDGRPSRARRDGRFVRWRWTQPGVQAQCEHIANVCVSMWLFAPSACPPACWTTVQYDGLLLVDSAPDESLGNEPRTW